MEGTSKSKQEEMQGSLLTAHQQRQVLKILTALLEGLIRPIPAVFLRIADLVHSDTFSRMALEYVWSFTGCHCCKIKKARF